MPLWELTHGKVRGAYLKAGVNELYVRQCAVPMTDGSDRQHVTKEWAWYVDGILMGVASGETTAKAASEAAVRAMAGTHTARLAAAT